MYYVVWIFTSYRTKLRRTTDATVVCDRAGGTSWIKCITSCLSFTRRKRCSSVSCGVVVHHIPRSILLESSIGSHQLGSPLSHQTTNYHASCALPTVKTLAKKNLKLLYCSEEKKFNPAPLLYRRAHSRVRAGQANVFYTFGFLASVVSEPVEPSQKHFFR